MSQNVRYNCEKIKSPYNLLRPLISSPSVHEKKWGCPQQPL